MLKRVRSLVEMVRQSQIHSTGGFIFAESPRLEAPDAKIIWCAALDPGTLKITASPAGPRDPGSLDPLRIAGFLSTVVDQRGIEHAVLSDGLRHIRLDVGAGSLWTETPLFLNFTLTGLRCAELNILPLRRFLHLCRYRRFSRSLFPVNPRMGREIARLRVYDALIAGASQRQIGIALFGPDRIANGWIGPSDSLRSRVRRLTREARMMAKGGYRFLR